jgi:hypothetical protein
MVYSNTQKFSRQVLTLLNSNHPPPSEIMDQIKEVFDVSGWKNSSRVDLKGLGFVPGWLVISAMKVMFGKLEIGCYRSVRKIPSSCSCASAAHNDLATCEWVSDCKLFGLHVGPLVDEEHASLLVSSSNIALINYHMSYIYRP